jgi:hypothetical protein
MPNTPTTYFVHEILPLLIVPVVICLGLLYLRWRCVDRWIKKASMADPKPIDEPLSR